MLVFSPWISFLTISVATSHFVRFSLLGYIPFTPLACEKLLPYVAGAVLVLLVIFALYVRSVPPKQPKPKPTVRPPPGGKIIPEFMNIDTTAKDLLNKHQEEQQPAAAGNEETKGEDETVVSLDEEDSAQETTL